jgi:hypothetical protein
MKTIAWSTYAAGETVGERGPAGGCIVRDEVHACGARITLEEGASSAPFVITCRIADMLEHSYATSASGGVARVFNTMKSDLERIAAAVLPVSADEKALPQLIGEFVRSYR